MNDELRAWILAATGAAHVQRSERIQMLWSGYGELTRVHLSGAGAAARTVILKWVKPPSSGDRPGRVDAVSHARKCRSYDVETAFYRTYAPRCDEGCRVAALLGARSQGSEWVLLLEDLDAAGFPARHRSPRGPQLAACLAWLAALHARFLAVAPEGLWEVGTYWHLGTRREELSAIREGKLRDAAPELDRRLRTARFQTLVHGDAKPDNFCFTEDGLRVAAVDFQYVGGGAGIRDIAYLLHGERPRAGVESSIALYFERLRAALPATIDADALESEWRALYPVACEDFERFLAGWRR